jgi:hypothetical protein
LFPVLLAQLVNDTETSRHSSYNVGSGSGNHMRVSVSKGLSQSSSAHVSSADVGTDKSPTSDAV